MFGKKTQPPIGTLIGEGTVIRGEVRFSEGLRIDGEIIGDVVAAGDQPSILVISEKARVTGKVKAAITADNGMKDSDISVKTENGIVTLSGNVKSPDQVTLAAALAQRQEGVNRVENQVAVK